MKEGRMGRLALIACVTAGSALGVERALATINTQQKRVKIYHIAENLETASEDLSPASPGEPEIRFDGFPRGIPGQRNFQAAALGLHSAARGMKSEGFDSSPIDGPDDVLEKLRIRSDDAAVEAQRVLAEVKEPVDERIDQLDTKSYKQAGVAVGDGAVGLGIFGIRRIRRRRRR